MFQAAKYLGIGPQQLIEGPAWIMEYALAFADAEARAEQAKSKKKK